MIDGEEIIAGVDLTMYFGNGDSYTLPLSSAQTAIIIKILGLSKDGDDGDIACYSDETLKQFLKFKGNPLRLRIFAGTQRGLPQPHQRSVRLRGTSNSSRRSGSGLANPHKP